MASNVYALLLHLPTEFLLYLVLFPLFVAVAGYAVSQFVAEIGRLKSRRRRLEIHAPVEVLPARKSETEEGRERRAA